jgi:hypothetical protein
MANRVKRYVFADCCLAYKERFTNSIFIDESTVRMQCNANRIWYRQTVGETRLGLIGRYKHTPTVNVQCGA